MKYVLIALALLFTAPAFSDDIFRIEIGKEKRKYSDEEQQRRIWQLERAVWQLQQRVFQLEESGSKPAAETWSCTITAMGDNFVGTGATKAVANANALKSCKAANNGDGFFCKDAKCEQ